MMPLDPPGSLPPDAARNGRSSARDSIPRPHLGRLWLIPNGLDLGTGLEVPLPGVLPQAAIDRAAVLGHWVVENAKTARAFLKRVNAVTPLVQPLQSIDIRELPRSGKGRLEGSATELADLLAPTRAGRDVGLLSEAGLPAVADPGAALVRAAHETGIDVMPLSGPSSLMLALAGSGLNGQSFAFVGYLPVDASARQARLRELEQTSRRLGQTQIAIETPYRNTALFKALLDSLSADTLLCVARGLTLPGGRTDTRAVKRWREKPIALDDHIPAVFLWLAH